MIVLVCGSREINNYSLVEKAIHASGFPPTKIIGGGARGVDTRAKLYATINQIPFEEFPADWDTHGKNAGKIRNRTMVDLCDAVVAVWDGRSPGTRHTIKYAELKGKPVFIFQI